MYDVFEICIGAIALLLIPVVFSEKENTIS